MRKNDDFKHILDVLNKMQEAYDKAVFCNNAALIIQIYDKANSVRNNLILSMHYGLCGDVSEYIAQCDVICEQCNKAMTALGNKTMQAALMSKWRDLAINMF